MPDQEFEGDLTDYFVTETIFNSGTTLSEVEQFLKNRKTTGKITTERNMSQGGSQTVKVVERTKLTVSQSEHMRQLLGWYE